jgi:hypothetical protein
LGTHLDQIQSKTCKAKVEKVQAHEKRVKAGCAEEIKADKCTDMSIGSGLLKCLGANRKSLSEGCRAAMHVGGGGKGGKQAGKGAAEQPADE